MLQQHGLGHQRPFSHYEPMAAADILIEDEAQLSDFEGGNLEVVLSQEILDPVPDDISGFNW